jgi:hypothetical protein
MARINDPAPWRPVTEEHLSPPGIMLGSGF